MLFFKSKQKKAKERAEDWLRLAQKIYDYRWDVLPEEDVKKLKEEKESLRSLIKGKQATPEDYSKATEKIEPLLKRTGGTFYPKTFWAENTEMLLVAAILAIGIRSFFIQPFKIPTNSMYPTYNGMTAHVYEEADSPALPVQGFRFLALGAKHFRLEAPESGELSVSLSQEGVPGRKWFVIPTQKARFTFYIGDSEVSVDLPLDFAGEFQRVLVDIVGKRPSRGTLSNGERVIKTGKRYDKGEAFLAFDLLTGDQLFVDRISYNFVRPDVGDPIVFRTQNIEHIDDANRGKYYIKRAVAGPGDILEIDPPGLNLNDKPIEGAKAFEKNRLQEGEYSGYETAGSSHSYPIPRQSGRQVIEIPEEHYFAMGDNSPQSADSRMWGFVPQREIVGKALFIYYPFSHRWGPAE